MTFDEWYSRTTAQYDQYCASFTNPIRDPQRVHAGTYYLDQYYICAANAGQRPHIPPMEHNPRRDPRLLANFLEWLSQNWNLG